MRMIHCGANAGLMKTTTVPAINRLTIPVTPHNNHPSSASSAPMTASSSADCNRFSQAWRSQFWVSNRT